MVCQHFQAWNTFWSKCKWHVFSRSNICHVSPDVPASESLESSPGTPESPGVSNYRHHSLEEFHSIQYSPSRVVLQSEEQSESSSSSTRLSSTSSGHEEEEPVWEDNQLLRRPLLTTSRNGSPQLRARITSSPAEITLSSAAKNWRIGSEFSFLHTEYSLALFKSTLDWIISRLMVCFNTVIHQNFDSILGSK